MYHLNNCTMNMPLVTSTTESLIAFDRFSKGTMTNIAGADLAVSFHGGTIYPVKTQTGHGIKFAGDSAISLPAPTIMNGNLSFHIMFRIDDDGVATQDPTMAIFSIDGGVSQELQSNNILMAALVNPDNSITILSEYGAGQNVTITTDMVDLHRNQWTLLSIIRGGYSTFDNKSDYSVAINGSFVNIKTGLSPTPALVKRDFHGIGTLSPKMYVGAAVPASNIPFNRLSGTVDFIHVDSKVYNQSEMFDYMSHILNENTNKSYGMSVYADSVNHEIDLTNFLRRDLVSGCTIDESVDNNVSTSTLSMPLVADNIFLSPEIKTSPLNTTSVVFEGVDSPLIGFNHAISIFAGQLGVFSRKVSSNMRLMMDGTMVNVASSGVTLKLSCQDEGGILTRSFIEQEFFYGHEVKDKSFNVTPVQDVMDQILRDNDNLAGNNYSTLDRDELAHTIRDGSYDPVSLYFDRDPAWDVVGKFQTKEMVMTALQKFPAMIGYSLKYRQISNYQKTDRRLSFYEPDRLREDVDFVATESSILSFKSAELSGKNRRNIVRVSYFSSEAVQPVMPTLPAEITHIRSGWNGMSPDNVRKVSFVEVGNTLSMNTDGRMFMEVGEGTSSQIDTLAEAVKMAVGIYLDVSADSVTSNAVMAFNPLITTQTVIRFPFDDVFSDTDSKLAVQSVSHSIGSLSTTTVNMRGKPAAGGKRWLDMEVATGSILPIATSPFGFSEENSRIAGMISGTLINTTDFHLGDSIFGLSNGSLTGFTNGNDWMPDKWVNASDGLRMDVGVSQFTSSMAATYGFEPSGGKAIMFGGGSSPFVKSKWAPMSLAAFDVVKVTVRCFGVSPLDPANPTVDLEISLLNPDQENGVVSTTVLPVVFDAKAAHSATEPSVGYITIPAGSTASFSRVRIFNGATVLGGDFIVDSVKVEKVNPLLVASFGNLSAPPNKVDIPWNLADKNVGNMLTALSSSTISIQSSGLYDISLSAVIDYASSVGTRVVYIKIAVDNVYVADSNGTAIDLTATSAAASISISKHLSAGSTITAHLDFDGVAITPVYPDNIRISVTKRT